MAEQLVFDDVSFADQRNYDPIKDYFKKENQKGNSDYLDITCKIHMAKEEDDYKMPKELYQEVLSSNNPKVYLFLLGGAPEFNRSYDGVYKNDLSLVRIDINLIYNKLLAFKDVKLIYIALSSLEVSGNIALTPDKLELKYTFKKCENDTVDFLENCDDKEFFKELITFVRIDWDSHFSSLLKIIKKYNMSDKELWEYIISRRLLNNENMLKLIGGKITLMIMYLINANKFKGDFKKLVNSCLQNEGIREEFISIDEDFFNDRIKPMSQQDYDLTLKIAKTLSKNKRESLQYSLFDSEKNNSNTNFIPEDTPSSGTTYLKSKFKKTNLDNNN